MLYNYSEILKLYKNDYNLLNAIKSKKIFKIERGIYSDQRNNYNKYELLLKKYPKSFLVKDSALFYINFLTEEPPIVHLGTARNALRIHDTRVKQHFYKNLDNIFIKNSDVEHILSISNITSYITENGNEIRILNIKALLYDLIRNKSKIKQNRFNKIINKFKNCYLLDSFDVQTTEYNLDFEQVYEYDYNLLYELDFISWHNNFDKKFYD